MKDLDFNDIFGESDFEKDLGPVSDFLKRKDEEEMNKENIISSAEASLEVPVFKKQTAVVTMGAGSNRIDSVKAIVKEQEAELEEVETQKKILKAMDKKKDQAMSGKEKGKESIFKDKKIRAETIENRVIDILKNEIYISNENEILHILNKDGSNVFEPMNDKEMLSKIADVIDSIGAFKYKKVSVYESCLKTLYVEMYNFKDRYKDFERNFHALKVKGTDKFVHLRYEEDFINGDDLCLRVYPASTDNLCALKLNGEISIENFKGENEGDVFDFDFSKKWKYVPRVKADGLWQHMLNTSYTDPAHHVAAAQFYGAPLTGIEIQTALTEQSNGGTGKTVKMTIGRHVYGKYCLDYDASSDYTFNTMSIPGKRIMFIDEVEEQINEKQMKKIIGGSGMTIPQKFRAPIENYDTSGMCVFFYVNDMFKAKDQHESTERRYFFIQSGKKVKEEDKILSLPKKIIKGDRVMKDGKWITYESDLESFIGWMHIGGFETFKRGDVLTPRNVKDPSLQAFNAKMLNIMIATREFFSEFDLKPSPTKGSGISKASLYSVYQEWCRSNNAIPRSRKKFLSDVESRYETNFGVKLEECRVDGGARGYAIHISCAAEYNKENIKVMERVMTEAEIQLMEESKVVEMKRKIDDYSRENLKHEAKRLVNGINKIGG